MARRASIARRVTQWVGSADTGFTTIGAGASVLMQSIATLGNTTVVRVRGIMSVTPGSVASDQNLVGAMGIGIVSDQAFAAGAASIPGPWTDPDWGGWLVWLPWSFAWEFGTAVGVQFRGVESIIDSKAMRKIAPNETLVVMGESQSAAAAVATSFRLLVKLA